MAIKQQDNDLEQDEDESDTPEISKDEAEDNNSDDDSSEEKILPAVNTLVAKGKQYNNLKNNPTKNPETVSQVLSRLLGSNSNQELEAAKAKQSQKLLFARLAHAGAIAGQAFTPLATDKVDENFYNNLEKSAAQPIQDIQNKNLLNMEKLKEKSIIDKIDPNSSSAGLARDLAKQKALKAGYNLDPDTLNNAPLGDLEKLNGSLSADSRQKAANDLKQSLVTEQINARAANAKLAADTRQNQLDNKSDDRDAAAEDKKISKENDNQRQTLGRVNTLLESSRGNPQVQQAQKDIYSATKAQTLLNLFPNPDDMSAPMVHLLVTEGSKIASGGVPAQADIVALMPDTVRLKLSSLWSKVTNQPTPAHAGDFIKQYKNYIDGLHSDAQDVIKDKMSRVLESNKKNLGDDNYTTLKANYLDPYLQPLTSKVKSKSNNSSTLDSSTPKDSSEDSAAIAWAKSNPNDPRAASILKVNGL